MSEKEKPAFNFGGSIGNLNINSDSGVQVTGSGDYVAGDKRQGEINVAGNLHGGVSQVFGGGISTAVEWVDRLATEFKSAAELSASDAKDAEETFAKMRELAAVEEPPQGDVDTVMGRLRSMFESRGGKVVRAVGNAISAGLQATVQTHPLVVAGMTLMDGLKEAFED